MKKMIVLAALFCVIFSLAEAQKKRIVYVGDSHTVGYFGKQLTQELAGAFHGQVNRYGVTSSGINHWMKLSELRGLAVEHIRSETTEDGKVAYQKYRQGRVPRDFPSFNQLLKAEVGTVVIALGTNDIASLCLSPKTLQEQARKMLELAEGKACVWVGPPSFAKESSVISRGCRGLADQYDTTVDLLRKEIEDSGCFYVDSRKFRQPGKTFPPKSPEDCFDNATALYPDEVDNLHLHFGERLGTYWGRCTGMVIKQALGEHEFKPIQKKK